MSENCDCEQAAYPLPKRGEWFEFEYKRDDPTLAFLRMSQWSNFAQQPCGLFDPVAAIPGAALPVQR